MKSIQATDLRKNLFKVLERLAVRREPVEVVRFKKPVAVLLPSLSLPLTRRKPVLDLDEISKVCKSLTR